MGGNAGDPSPGSGIVAPSVPASSLHDTPPQARLLLKVDAPYAAPGHSLTLTATSDRAVTGTGTVIEIFDLATGVLIAGCASGSQCSVAYSARAGIHTFAAFVTPFTRNLPTQTSIASSNQVEASWIGVTLAAQRSVASPGQAVDITAASTVGLDGTGRLLEIYDAVSHVRLTYCSSGNTCSTSLRQPVGGSKSLLAAIAPPSDVIPGPDQIAAQSNVLKVSWLSVAVRAVTTSSQPGGVIHVVATANTNVAQTPWSIGILDQDGQLVGPVCKSGISCSATVEVTTTLPSFTAVIGTVPAQGQGRSNKVVQKVSGPSTLVDIQAQSPLVQPMVHASQFLWGVDSCKSFTSGIYPQVASQLGRPDFWGRYLTDTMCPGISADEVAAAHQLDMGILPIYNDYVCSDVVGYDTAQQYASAAVNAAQNLGIAQGVALAIDIEPPGDACPGAGNVDAGFISGWYDGVVAAGYVPAYYGNGTAQSEFATAYCAAVGSRPEIADNSHVWTFEPSLLGGYTKGDQPDWGLANDTSCPEHGTAWQFQIGSNSADPDVDQDLLTSDFPLWYP